jgi:ribosome maturation factor RimP
MVAVLWLIVSTSGAAQKLSSEPTIDAEAQSCASLTELDLERAPGGPAFIVSAQLLEVPADGLERPLSAPSGYGDTTGPIVSRVHQCDLQLRTQFLTLLRVHIPRIAAP